jgi:hypothetical protein
MATTFSCVHVSHCAFPRPPTPTIAMLIFDEGAQLMKLGIITTPVATAEDVLKKFLLEIEFITIKLSGFRSACEVRMILGFINFLKTLFEKQAKLGCVLQTHIFGCNDYEVLVLSNIPSISRVHFLHPIHSPYCPKHLRDRNRMPNAIGFY